MPLHLPKDNALSDEKQGPTFEVLIWLRKITLQRLVYKAIFRRKQGIMRDDKEIPKFDSYEEMAAFWDTHSLADYWDQTESVDFDFAPEARRRYLVGVDREVLARVQRLARTRGVSIESLVNLLLEQRLLEIENQTSKV